MQSIRLSAIKKRFALTVACNKKICHFSLELQIPQTNLLETNKKLSHGKFCWYKYMYIIAQSKGKKCCFGVFIIVAAAAAVYE